jgi:orotidine-5'-phosphate decarboxylase
MERFENIPSIIPSMDVDIEDMVRIIDNVKNLKKEVGGLKIGSLLIWKYGLEKVVSEIKSVCDLPIMFDAQKAGTDIPSIVEEQVRLVADVDIDAFIASPLGSGSKTLESFIKTSFECDVTPIVVLEMTHPMANAFLKEDVGEKILTQSLEMGVENFVAPANNPERIRIYRNLASEKDKTIKIFSPGVGPQGGGPDTAVEAGTDFVITGRSVYQAKNPAEEIIRMYALIKKAYGVRKDTMPGY